MADSSPDVNSDNERQIGGGPNLTRVPIQSRKAQESTDAVTRTSALMREYKHGPDAHKYSALSDRSLKEIVAVRANLEAVGAASGEEAIVDAVSRQPLPRPRPITDPTATIGEILASKREERQARSSIPPKAALQPSASKDDTPSSADPAVQPQPAHAADESGAGLQDDTSSKPRRGRPKKHQGREAAEKVGKPQAEPQAKTLGEDSSKPRKNAAPRKKSNAASAKPPSNPPLPPPSSTPPPSTNSKTTPKKSKTTRAKHPSDPPLPPSPSTSTRHSPTSSPPSPARPSPSAGSDISSAPLNKVAGSGNPQSKNADSPARSTTRITASSPDETTPRAVDAEQAVANNTFMDTVDNEDWEGPDSGEGQDGEAPQEDRPASRGRLTNAGKDDRKKAYAEILKSFAALSERLNRPLDSVIRQFTLQYTGHSTGSTVWNLFQEYFKLNRDEEIQLCQDEKAAENASQELVSANDRSLDSMDCEEQEGFEGEDKKRIECSECFKHFKTRHGDDNWQKVLLAKLELARISAGRGNFGQRKNAFNTFADQLEDLVNGGDAQDFAAFAVVVGAHTGADGHLSRVIVPPSLPDLFTGGAMVLTEATAVYFLREAAFSHFNSAGKKQLALEVAQRMGETTQALRQEPAAEPVRSDPPRMQINTGGKLDESRNSIKEFMLNLLIEFGALPPGAKTLPWFDLHQRIGKSGGTLCNWPPETRMPPETGDNGRGKQGIKLLNAPDVYPFIRAISDPKTAPYIIKNRPLQDIMDCRIPVIQTGCPDFTSSEPRGRQLFYDGRITYTNETREQPPSPSKAAQLRSHTGSRKALPGVDDADTERPLTKASSTKPSSTKLQFRLPSIPELYDDDDKDPPQPMTLVSTPPSSIVPQFNRMVNGKKRPAEDSDDEDSDQSLSLFTSRPAKRKTNGRKRSEEGSDDQDSDQSRSPFASKPGKLRTNGKKRSAKDSDDQDSDQSRSPFASKPGKLRTDGKKRPTKDSDDQDSDQSLSLFGPSPTKRRTKDRSPAPFQQFSKSIKPTSRPPCNEALQRLQPPIHQSQQQAPQPASLTSAEDSIDGEASQPWEDRWVRRKKIKDTTDTPASSVQPPYANSSNSTKTNLGSNATTHAASPQNHANVNVSDSGMFSRPSSRMSQSHIQKLDPLSISPNAPTATVVPHASTIFPNNVEASADVSKGQTSSTQIPPSLPPAAHTNPSIPLPSNNHPPVLPMDTYPNTQGWLPSQETSVPPAIQVDQPYTHPNGSGYPFAATMFTPVTGNNCLTASNGVIPNNPPLSYNPNSWSLQGGNVPQHLGMNQNFMAYLNGPEPAYYPQVYPAINQNYAHDPRMEHPPYFPASR